MTNSVMPCNICKKQIWITEYDKYNGICKECLKTLSYDVKQED